MVFSYQGLYSVVKKHAKAIFCLKYLATWSAGKDWVHISIAMVKLIKYTPLTTRVQGP